MKGKLLIVDDEPLIRLGITKLVQNHVPGWVIAGEADNGQEAKEQIRRLRPDAVLTDIRMPVMDGLELAQWIRTQDPNIIIIILTGYGDFEYAQSALRYGVRDFLLKPCKEKELCRCLSEAYISFIEATARRRREEQEKREKANQLFRSVLLMLPYSAGESAQLLARLDGKELWLLKVQSYLVPDKNYRDDDVQLLQFAIGNIVSEYMGASCGGEGEWLIIQHDTFALLLELGQSHQAWLEQAAATVKQYLGLAVSLHLLGAMGSISHLKEAYRQFLLTGPRHEAAYDFGYTLDEGEFRSTVEKIAMFLQLGQAMELQQYLDSLISGDNPSKGKSLEKRKMQALSKAMALNEVARKHLEMKGASEIGFQVSELSALHEHRQVDEWLLHRINSFKNLLQDWLDARNSGLMDKALRYLEGHYMEECSMVTVANQIHLSPNYFSNLFKKQTGETFSNYLTKLRIRKAELLLSNTDMKISEIAQSVGYQDSNYFATAFRQITGMSPSQYRKHNERTP